MAAARRVRSKVKKKMWLPIIAPGIFRNQVVGETNVMEPSQAMGKIMPANVMNLTGDARKQNLSVKLQVTEVSGDKAKTSLLGYQMVPASLKRLIRRGKEKVETTFNAQTKDNKKINLKLVMVTRNACSNSVLTSLRKEAEKFLVEFVNKSTYDQFFDSAINHRVQNEMKKLLAKIYPLKICEIRQANLVKPKRHVDEVKEEETQKESTEEAPESKEETKAQEPAKEVKEEQKAETTEEPKKAQAKEVKPTKKAETKTPAEEPAKE